MRIYSLSPDSTTKKTAIFFALNSGYRFKLTGKDGVATITSPAGDTYQIHNWTCDCADSMMRDGGSYTIGDTERHLCKHCIWLSQLYPCPNCSGYMMLRMDEAWKHFQCCTPACWTMEAFQLVKANRQATFRQMEQEADVLKTHQPEDVDAIIAQAEEASNAIFAD